MKKKISLIIPIYNSENTIERCINSVKVQSYSNWEAILIDDGSVDKSFSLSQKLTEEDKRFRLYTQSNCGVSATRNIGITLAEGDYIFFLDSDDEIAADLLERYGDIIDACEPDIIAGSLCFVLQDGTEYSKGHVESGLYGYDIWNRIAENSEPFGWAGSKCIRRELLVQKQLRFREDMKSQEDLEFNLRVYKESNKIYLSDYPGYIYYYTPSNRIPPIADIIGNQIKIHQYADDAYIISETAENKLIGRLVTIVYTYLYEADTKEKMATARETLARCPELNDILSRKKASGEKKLVIGLMIGHHYSLILFYFKIRNAFRDIVRRLGK